MPAAHAAAAHAAVGGGQEWMCSPYAEESGVRGALFIRGDE